MEDGFLIYRSIRSQKEGKWGNDLAGVIDLKGPFTGLFTGIQEEDDLSRLQLDGRTVNEFLQFMGISTDLEQFAELELGFQ